MFEKNIERRLKKINILHPKQTNKIKKMKKINGFKRKGQEFGIWLMIFVYLTAVILIGVRFSSQFSTPKMNEGIGFRQNALYAVYGEAEKIQLYEETLAKKIFYAAVKSFADKGLKQTTYASSSNMCGTYGYDLWLKKNELCVPEPNQKGMFSQLEIEIGDKMSKNSNSFLKGKMQNVNITLIGEDLAVQGGLSMDVALPIFGIKNYDYSRLQDIYRYSGAQPTPSVPLASGEGVFKTLPAGSTTLKSCYGERTVNGKLDFHAGVDFAAPVGTPVYAVADGVVVDTCSKWVGECACSSAKDDACRINCKQYCHNYGNYLVIKHSDNLYTIYAHLSKILLKPEEKKVKAGDKIAETGDTGYSEGPHLHFGVSKTNIFSKNERATTTLNPLCLFPEQLISRLKIASTATSCITNRGYGDTMEYADIQQDSYCKELAEESFNPGINPVVGGSGDQSQDVSGQETQTTSSDSQTQTNPENQQDTNTGNSVTGSAVSSEESKPWKCSTSRNFEITYYHSKVITEYKEWCSSKGCFKDPYNYLNLGFGVKKSCLDDKKGYCCIPENARGIYEEAKCQGTVYYKGKEYKYNTVKTEPPLNLQEETDITELCAKTSTGKCATRFRTVAVDPGMIPYGSKVCIDLGEGNPFTRCYVAEDTGSGIIDYKIDIFGGYFEDEIKEAKKYIGKKIHGVCIYPPGSNVPITPDISDSSSNAKGSDIHLIDTPLGSFENGLWVNVLGEYRFRPAFSLNFKNPFGGVSTLFAWASRLKKVCTDDIAECLKKQVNFFNSDINTFNIYTSDDKKYKELCEPDSNKRMFYDTVNFVEDCIANKQKGCYCELNMPKESNLKSASFRFMDKDILMRQEGTVQMDEKTDFNMRRYITDGKLSESGEEEKFIPILSLKYNSNGKIDEAVLEKEFITSKRSLETKELNTDYKSLLLYKDTENSVAIETKKNTDEVMCQEFKDSFRLCAVKEIKDPLFKKIVGDNLVVKFAVQLEDKKAPEQVSSLQAQNNGDKIVVVHSGSTSPDISYFKVYCADSPDGLNQAVGKDDYKTTSIIRIDLDSCAGKKISSGKDYYVAVTSVDKAGNENTDLHFQGQNAGSSNPAGFNTVKTEPVQTQD